MFIPHDFGVWGAALLAVLKLIAFVWQWIIGLFKKRAPDEPPEKQPVPQPGPKIEPPTAYLLPSSLVSKFIESESYNIESTFLFEVDPNLREVVRAAKMELHSDGDILESERREERAKAINSKGARLLLLAIFLSQVLALWALSQTGKESTLMAEAALLVCLITGWLIFETKFEGTFSPNRRLAVRC